MNFKIIADSCTDLTKEMKKFWDIKLVPLMLSIGNKHYSDDVTFVQQEFLHDMKSTNECPKSACPSPASFMKEIEEADESFIVTLSGKMSGSYSSAVVAKNMVLEEHPEKKIEVIDSHSASIGQTLIVMKLKELKEKGLNFEQIREKIFAFRDSLNTKFVLESIENLRRNGRMSNIAATIANVLNIKPVLCADSEGNIEKLDQARGVNKALSKLVDSIVKDARNASERILGIANCNCRERAEKLRDEIMARVPFKDCVIVDTAGVSTLYADDGGIIVVY